jgi:NNP family nitrate/nitrite transporter-like MFS transporter
VYAAPVLPNLHVGYALVAISMVPIVALSAWVFQPDIAERASDDGLVDRRDATRVTND